MGSWQIRFIIYLSSFMGKLTEMTLAEVIPSARRLSIVEKLQIIQILAADLDISPLELFKIYNI
jgi:hypothetical protein